MIAMRWSATLHRAGVIWVRIGKLQSDANQIAQTIQRAVSKLPFAVGQYGELSFIPRIGQSIPKCRSPDVQSEAILMICIP
jgi:hypothetical protein